MFWIDAHKPIVVVTWELSIRFALFCALTLICWTSPALAAGNQDLHLELHHDENDRPVLDLQADDVPLTEVLNSIGELASIDIRCWQEISDPINLSVKQAPVQDIFDRLQANLALSFLVDPESGQYRIVGLDALPESTASLPQETTPPQATAIGQSAPDNASQHVPKPAQTQDSSYTTTSPKPRFKPQELLIRFVPGTASARQQTLHRFLGSTLLEHLPSLNFARLKLADFLSEDEAIRLYLASGIVETAEKHALRYVQSAAPDDPEFSTQHMPKSIGLPRAWDLTQGTQEVVVTVIDTGMDTLHPDLLANIRVNEQERLGEIGVDDDQNGYVDDITGYDFADDNGDVTDVDGHGTHVAGIIGARGNNGLGVTGVNWRVRIMPLKVQGDSSSSILEIDVIQALNYALNQGVQIINCSFGGEQFNDLERDAFLRIQEANGLAVCPAGNGGLNIDLAGNELYPASYDLQGIIAVAAGDSDATGQPILADFSNFGPASVDLMPPGCKHPVHRGLRPDHEGRRSNRTGNDLGQCTVLCRDDKGPGRKRAAGGLWLRLS